MHSRARCSLLSRVVLSVDISPSACMSASVTPTATPDSYHTSYSVTTPSTASAPTYNSALVVRSMLVDETSWHSYQLIIFANCATSNGFSFFVFYPLQFCFSPFHAPFLHSPCVSCFLPSFPIASPSPFPATPKCRGWMAHSSKR